VENASLLLWDKLGSASQACKGEPLMKTKMLPEGVSPTLLNSRLSHKYNHSYDTPSRERTEEGRGL